MIQKSTSLKYEPSSGLLLNTGCGRDRLISQLELQNRKTMRQISQRLGDLSAETDHKADA